MDGPDSFTYYPASGSQKPSKRGRRTYETGSSEVGRPTSVQPCVTNNTRRRRNTKLLGGLPTASTSYGLSAMPFVLPAPVKCYHCQARKFAYESLHFCCGNGTIKLASNEYPLILSRLFTSKDEDAVHFRQYARAYNNMFAYTSIGGKIESRTEKGIYVFKLYGQVYHYLPTLLPENSQPKYLQLYFYDGQHESENRANCFPELREAVIDVLIEVTRENPYAIFFRSLRELNVSTDTQIIINKNTVLDQRTYNAPQTNEVAVIWPESTASSYTSSPHIVVSGKDNASHRVMHYYGCYDPLQYPLLFPYGDCGWTQGLLKVNKEQHMGTSSDVLPGPNSRAAHEDSDWVQHMVQVDAEQHQATSSNVGVNPAPQTVQELLQKEAARAVYEPSESEKHVSCREYYCYKLQSRPSNMLLRAGRCYQQYIVDMYVKLESTRLDFHRHNQDTIRADLYQGILDTFASGEHVAANVGRRVILPPTFLGGPRDMKRRYLNAMSLVQRFGKPDIFLTITCNTNWPKIKQELASGEQPQDRPDIVARIFRAKLLALKKQIMDKQVFGEVAAIIYVVEFQKRGLPHAHFLIILKPTFKIKCPADFDKFVSAEIPKKTSANLRKLVLKHMMHGPCGHLNPTCPCMKHAKSPGVCKSGYPRQFVDETTSNSDGFPIYRRCNNGDNALIRNATLDNRWVIPYNPYLLAMFDCHINVEVCSTIQAVKYLYKYVYKGHDRISFDIVAQSDNPVIDEISQFQSGRWVSPCEAAWRIFGFDLFEMHPSVMPLQVHLPNMQTIQVRPSEQLRDIVRNERRIRTPLTEFFATNTNVGTNYLYSEFTEHYRWDLSSKRWLLRKNKTIAIGRLAFVAPAEGERYFLRLLLQNIRGPNSFEDLVTVDGIVCASFQEAALKHHLLEADDTVELCMSEASEVQMPSALRRLFATLLIFCQPKDPCELWTRHYLALSNDYSYKYPKQPSKVRLLTITAIEQYLEAMGKSLDAFGLGHLQEERDNEVRRTKDIVDALDAPIPQECMDSRHVLNTGQQEAFDTIINHVQINKPGAFFIDGPGGTGKTFLYNALYAEVRMMGKIVLPTATSGIAASNIPSGRTAHSRFKIPIDSETSLSCDVPKQGSLAALIKETALIIWDEASMARKENIESLDLLLRDLCNSNHPFGGKIVVFGGDFRQVLPVLPRKSQKEAVEASLVSSPLWNQLIKFRLIENIRAREDPNYSSFLLALGDGKLQSSEHGFVELPPEIAHSSQDQHDQLEIIATLAFPELNLHSFAPEIFNTRAILTPMNDDVDSINSALIEKFPGSPYMYKSFDSLLDDNCNVYPTEFINKLCPGGMSPHELILKENCPVILIRNLLPSSGLCNGTRLLCKRFFRNLIECVITNGHHQGVHVFIPRIILRPSASVSYPFQFQRKQFPLKLSFAMTINKAQGQTLSRVLVYLPRPCFSHGQLYVALSRARRATNVTVVSTITALHPGDTYVKNIVAYDVLRLAGIH